MRYQKLADTNVQVPEIGLGTWEYRGGIEPLQRGLSLGAFFIDTAEIYGTEEIVGKAIQGRRNEVFLATKVAPDHFEYQGVIQAANRSLKRLGTDYIDLYQLHWPNPDLPIEEPMAAMDKLVSSGKVRFIGVSNFSLAQFKEAQSVTENKLSLTRSATTSLTGASSVNSCPTARRIMLLSSPIVRWLMAYQISRPAWETGYWKKLREMPAGLRPR